VSRNDFEVAGVDASVPNVARIFLDLGAGLPARSCVHEMARAVAPDARVVYVDNDPGIVWMGQWRPDPSAPAAAPDSLLAGVGRKLAS
jgi:hypothetical protein